MRSLVGIGLLLTGVLVPGPAAAQDVEALRKELEQMRKQFDSMKDGYEKAINQLGERIQQLENRPQPAAAPPPAAPPPAAVAPGRRAPPAARGGDQPDGPGAAARALLPLRPARARAAPVRHGRGRRLHRQPHPEQCRQGQRGHRSRAARTASSRARSSSRSSARSIPTPARRSASRRARRIAGEIDAAPGRGQPDPDGAALRHPGSRWARCATASASSTRCTSTTGRSSTRPTCSRASWATRGSSSAAPSSPGCAPLPFFLEALVGAFNGDNETAFGRGKLNAARW